MANPTPVSSCYCFYLWLTLMPNKLLKLFLFPSLSEINLFLYTLITYIICIPFWIVHPILYPASFTVAPFFFFCNLFWVFWWRVATHNGDRSYHSDSADPEVKDKERVLCDKAPCLLWLYVLSRIWLKMRMKISSCFQIHRVMCQHENHNKASATSIRMVWEKWLGKPAGKGKSLI